jgi:hypothetical protein
MPCMRRSQESAFLGVLWASCWSLRGRWGRMSRQRRRARHVNQVSSIKQITSSLFEELVAPESALIYPIGTPSTLKIYFL